MSDTDERLIALVDLDCFYVQVEQRDRPHLWGKPTAVVQYTEYRGGGIIAVNYEARAVGVKRGMWGEAARQICPELNIVQTEVVRGKANLTKYRLASSEVFEILSSMGELVVVEKSSIDEAFLDLTELVNAELLIKDVKIDSITTSLPTSCVVSKSPVDTLESFVISSLGDPDAMLNHKLLVAAMLMERIRKEIKEKTQFSCSAGISYNKILAKLACGINKPNRQTIVPPDRVAALFRTTPIGKCRSLGGKLGSLLQEKLQISTMAELSCVSFDRLLSICDRKTAEWLNELAKGVERTPVVPHQLPKSIGSSKNFFGTSALKTSSDIFFWLTQLAAELFERLEEDRQKHQRLAASLTVGLRYAGTATVSRVIPIASYEVEKIAQLAFKCLQQFNRSSAESSEWTPPVNNLSLSASRFTLGSITDSTTITSFFRHKNKVAPEPECPSAISHSKKAKNDASTSSESSGNVADRSNCGRSIRTRDRKSMDRPAMSVNSFFIPQDIQQLPSDSLSERELLTGKKIEPEHSVTSSQLSGAHWVQLESSYVDEEVWKELPPDIRWELKQQMGRQNKFASTKDMNAKTIQHYFQPKESKRHKKEEADQSVSLSQFF